VEIRRAGFEDAAEIAQIHVAGARQTYAGIFTDEYLAALSVEDRALRWTEESKGHLVSGDPAVAVFAAVSDGVMIGFADTGPARDSEDPNCAELYAIYVALSWIGKGAGRALFGACVEHVKGCGFTAMLLRVLSRNAPARAFYERMGGEADLATEKAVAIGGTTEKVIVYRWASL
jgi:GNAT superfamily N-acetyltransferase